MITVTRQQTEELMAEIKDKAREKQNNSEDVAYWKFANDGNCENRAHRMPVRGIT